MDEILKMLFQSILFKREEIAEIKDTDNLYDTTTSPKQIIKIFAIMNDTQSNFSTEMLLKIANEAYQEVCANA